MSEELKLTTCPYCKNEIDLEVCWCGSDKNGHPYDLGHNFVPLGCDCGIAEASHD